MVSHRILCIHTVAYTPLLMSCGCFFIFEAFIKFGFQIPKSVYAMCCPKNIHLRCRPWNVCRAGDDHQHQHPECSLGLDAVQNTDRALTHWGLRYIDETLLLLPRSVKMGKLNLEGEMVESGVKLRSDSKPINNLYHSAIVTPKWTPKGSKFFEAFRRSRGPTGPWSLFSNSCPRLDSSFVPLK